MVKPTILVLLLCRASSQSLLRFSLPRTRGAGRVGSSFVPRTHAKPAAALPSETRGHDAPITPGHELYNLGRRAMGTLMGAAALGLPLKPAEAASDITIAAMDGVAEPKRQWSNFGVSEFSQGGVAPDPKGKTKDDKKGQPELILKGKISEEEKAIAWIPANTGYPDLSSCQGIALKAKSSTNSQYSIGLGLTATPFKKLGSPNSFAFKAKFQPSVSEDTFGVVQVPFTDFKSAKDAPLDPSFLKDIERVSLWAEDKGKYDLQVKEIDAYGCGATTEVMANLATFDVASGANIPWYVAAGTFGFLIFSVVRIRGVSAQIAQPSILG